jgi:hypothetical protein
MKSISIEAVGRRCVDIVPRYVAAREDKVQVDWGLREN